jgi:hypothetical protein
MKIEVTKVFATDEQCLAARFRPTPSRSALTQMRSASFDHEGMVNEHSSSLYAGGRRSPERFGVTVEIRPFTRNIKRRPLLR